MAKKSLGPQASSQSNDLVNAVGICQAAQAGDTESLRRILESEPDLLEAEHPHMRGKARQTAIHFAAREGHLEAVKLLLSAGANPLRGFFHNYPVPSALSLARSEGHFEIVQAIEDHVFHAVESQPGRLNETDEDGNTLLHLSVYHRHRPLVGKLLRLGAQVDARNNMGQRPIHLALYNGMGGPGEMLRDAYIDIAAILLDHGAELDLWCASAMGDVASVRRLIQDLPESINASNGARRYPGGADYPISIAAHNGHLEVVQLLLEHGAGPDVENDNEYRESDQLESGAPLVFAIARNHLDIAHLLIDRRARVDVSMIHSGPGILDVALESGNQALIDRIIIKGGKPFVGHYVDTKNYLVIRELLDRCPNDPTQSGGGWTNLQALLLAGVRSAEPSVVEMCLARNPDMIPGEGTWGRGSHCLTHHIIRSTFQKTSPDAHDRIKRILKMLLEYGVDPNDTDKQGRTTLHTAANAISGYEPNEPALVEIVAMIIDHGANIDAVDKEFGTTPLAWAIRYGRIELARYLIEVGASVDPDGVSDEVSPRMLAEKYGDQNVVDMLESKE